MQNGCESRFFFSSSVLVSAAAGMSAIALLSPPCFLVSSDSAPASQPTGRAFVYDRAAPCVRWPHVDSRTTHKLEDGGEDDLQSSPPGFNFSDNYMHSSVGEGKRYRSRKAVARLVPPDARVMSKLALVKARDWKTRVARLTDAICSLEDGLFVADILDAWTEQLHPTDLCFVVKCVGQTHWQRALEVYEWLNLRRWYSPNPRMLATVIGVLGRAKQVALAQELFLRVQAEVGDCVQVYNAIMSAHARQGAWRRVEQILVEMQESQVQPDLITFNIRANAQSKAGLQPGQAMLLLQDIRDAGLRPDIITYNTIISACSSSCCWEDALHVFQQMREQKCAPDIWTYNALISAFGRAGMADLAQEYFRSMRLEGFSPDAVSYNALLSAYARLGRVDDVEQMRVQMWEARCDEDEITFNTLLHMYGKLGLPDKALETYQEMKVRGCRPDGVTFTVLIDALGKAGLVDEAERLFEQMQEAEVWPTLQTFTALICAYAKAGLLTQAERTYDCLLSSGIVADELANSVMVDVFYRAGLSWRAMSAYSSLLATGCRPSLQTCSTMLHLYAEEGMRKEVGELVVSMQQWGFGATSLCSSFAKAGLWDEASAALRMAMVQGQKVDKELVASLLDSYAASKAYDEARSFVHSLPRGSPWLQEALIVMLAKADKVEEAMTEFEMVAEAAGRGTVPMYRALIVSAEQAGMTDAAVRLFEGMLAAGVQPDKRCYNSAVLSYCRLGCPERAYHCLQQWKKSSMSQGSADSSVCAAVIEAFGRKQLWEHAEKCFQELEQQPAASRVCTKALNALLFAYANSGQYDILRTKFDALNGQGVTLSDVSSDIVLKALHSEVTESTEVATFSPNKRTFVVVLNAFCKEGNVEEAKKVYEQMKHAGFVPQQQVYGMLVGLYAKKGLSEDAEQVLREMDEAGCAPDVIVNNAMLSLYSKLGNYKRASQVYKGMLTSGCVPDAVTYNTLINLYSRHQMVTEAYLVFQELLKAGCKPDVTTYTTLITGYGGALMWEACEALFKDMQQAGCQPNATTYHAMINAYRRVGMHEAAERSLREMEAAGFPPTATALHMVMDSYGKGGEPELADSMMERLRATGMSPSVLQYTALIDAYLKEGEYDVAASRLREMKKGGLKPSYVTFTCVLGASSRCRKRSDMLMLLAALRDVGFSLPFRLVTEEGGLGGRDVEDVFGELRMMGPGAGQGLVNVLQDVLWAFQKRATAGLVYQLAVKSRIYPDDLTQVESNKWGADLRRLSPGAALVVLSLWLLRMQEAALLASPEASKSVILVMGRNRNNNRVSLSKTLKAHLWEMGSPFLVSKTREGMLIAKQHSLRNWLRDSPLCMDLGLKDCPGIPAFNSMELYNGAWMKADMVPAFKQIEESMPEVRPKKFSRMAHMDQVKRSNFIAADIKHHAEKVDKDKRRPKKAQQRVVRRSRVVRQLFSQQHKAVAGTLSPLSE